jgi:DNA-binding GntR family transcriptional regulator
MLASSGWRRIQPTTLADQVYRTVRTRLLDGEIPPGGFVREQDLCALLGVSRTPVREALGRLASERFLERIPRRGFRTPEEPIADLLELYPVVATLELLAGKLAIPKLTAADVARLKTINRQLRQAGSPRNVGELIEINNRFHHVFCGRSGNRRLCELLHDLRRQLNRLEFWYYSDADHIRRSGDEHDAIIRAVEEGDVRKALSVLKNNMVLTPRSLREETRRSHSRDRS